MAIAISSLLAAQFVLALSRFERFVVQKERKSLSQI
jgi:hypothetical protein